MRGKLWNHGRRFQPFVVQSKFNLLYFVEYDTTELVIGFTNSRMVGEYFITDVHEISSGITYKNLVKFAGEKSL